MAEDKPVVTASGGATPPKGWAIGWTARLFNSMGYRVKTEVAENGFLLDLVVKRDGLSSPVEVKYYHPDRPVPLSDVSEQAARLHAVQSIGPLQAPILVIFGRLTRAARAWSQQDYSIRVWDIEELWDRAQPFPDLAAELDRFAVGTSKIFPEGRSSEEAEKLVNRLTAHIEKNLLSSTAYEELCREVFIFLFDPVLYGFQPQEETSDGGNRYDFICRIKSGASPFWDGMRHDFRTRAILFECKNYQEPIGPDQVYSTERYLFTGALRTVCLLIARIGASDGALRAAQGAMRESGKLILLLSNADLINMIKLKGSPEGPETYLDEKIWKFVISLPR